LVCLPSALKWMKQRYPGRYTDGAGQARFISALAVGPHQRVVTVEVGPVGNRVWLTLGVTTQNVSCLHCVGIDASAPPVNGSQSEVVVPNAFGSESGGSG
jgi:flagellar protein FliO/FliZ